MNLLSESGSCPVLGNNTEEGISNGDATPETMGTSTTTQQEHNGKVPEIRSFEKKPKAQKKKKKKKRRRNQVSDDLSAGDTTNLPLVITAKQLQATGSNLYVSNKDGTRDEGLLAALGIECLIIIGGGKQHGSQFLQQESCQFLHVGIKDRSDTSYLPIFQHVSEFVTEAVQKGNSILVHCQGGMHRSPAVAAAILIYHANLSSTQARRCIEIARPTADFSAHGKHLELELDRFEEMVTSCALKEETDESTRRRVSKWTK